MGRGRDHRCRYLPRRPTVGAPVPPLMVGVCMLYVDRSYINRSFLWCALAWTKEKWNADQATTSTSHPLRVQRVATRRAPPPPVQLMQHQSDSRASMRIKSVET